MNIKDFEQFNELIYVPTADEIRAESSDGGGLPFVKVPKEDGIVLRLLLPLNKDGDPSGPRPELFVVRRTHWIPTESGKNIPVPCLGKSCPVCGVHHLAVDKLCGGDYKDRYTLPSAKYGLSAKWGAIANVMYAKPVRGAESLDDFEWEGPKLMEFPWTIWSKLFGSDRDPGSKEACLNAKVQDKLWHPVQGAPFIVRKAPSPVHFHVEFVELPDGRRMTGPIAKTPDAVMEILTSKVIDLELTKDVVAPEVYEYGCEVLEAEVYATLAALSGEAPPVTTKPVAARTTEAAPASAKRLTGASKSKTLDVSTDDFNEAPASRAGRKSAFVDSDFDFDDDDA